jgi:hypothetical protein
MSSAAALGAADLGALTVGKKANFMIVPDPIGDIKNTRETYEVWIAGKQVDRIDLKRNAEVKVKGITQEQRNIERQIQTQEAIAAAEAKLPHYGNKQFVLATSGTNVMPGVTIQTPRHSNVTKSGGPPYKVTVSMPGAKAEDLRAFYSETLPGWRSAGGCWEKAPSFKICPEASAGQIVLTITQ